MRVVAWHCKLKFRLVFVVLSEADDLLEPLIEAVESCEHKHGEKEVNENRGSAVASYDVVEEWGQSKHRCFDNNENAEVYNLDGEVLTVPEHQAAQVGELVDCKVGECGGLVAFFAHDANTYMCLLDHVDVVGAITDSESDTAGDFFSDCLDKLCLLAWGSPVNDQTFGVKKAIYDKFYVRRLVKEQFCNRLPWNKNVFSWAEHNVAGDVLWVLNFVDFSVRTQNTTA